VLDLLKKALVKLLPERFLKLPGRLFVDVDEAGAEEFLNGKKIGVTPRVDFGELAPGAYQLRVTKEGRGELNKEIAIAPGETLRLTEHLPPLAGAGAAATLLAGAPPSADPAAKATPASPPAEQKTPIYKKWWFWTAVGTAAAVAIAVPIIVVTTRGEDTVEQPTVGFDIPLD